MATLPVAPRRVFGVALDAGADSGSHTWVCRGTPGGDGLRVESVDPLTELPGGVAERSAAHRVLLAKILEAPRSVWGIDLPLGIPLEEVPAPAPLHQASPWREGWVGDVRHCARWPEAGEPGHRRTERERGMAPASWAVRQLGVAGLLLPLLAQTSVAVLPFDPLPLLPPGAPPQMAGRLPSIFVVEVAPRALLGAAGIAAGDPESVLRALVAAQLVRPLARALRRRIAEGRAERSLDAVLAAVAAWRASRRDDLAALTRDPHYGREGYAFC